MSDILNLLRARHPAPEWAFFDELRNSVGYTRVTRTADAMAFNTFMGRGLEVHGFEIKRDRRDWLRELKNPDKAEEMFRFCDRWWLVVSDREIVKDDELPVNWGLLAPKKNSAGAATELAVVTKAPKLKSKPMTPGFLAMLLRRAVEQRTDTRRVEQEVESRMARERAAWADERERLLEQVGKLHGAEALKKSVEEFERASGVKIERWHGASIGRAFKIAMEMNPDVATQRLKDIRAQVHRLQTELDAILEPRGMVG